MYKVRTDLALEAHEENVKRGDRGDGIIANERNRGELKISTVDITTQKAKNRTGRDIGRYVTVEFGKVWVREHSYFTETVETLAEELRTLINRGEENCDSVLIVGLGNAYINADALGPRAVAEIIVTRHLKAMSPALYESFGSIELSALTPGVLGQTGIESASVIESVVKKIKPRLVIIIDALASRKIERLATTVQISDTGISPGSGMGNHRVAINAKLLGTRVISIGVPTVVDAATLAYDVFEQTCASGGAKEESMLTHEHIRETLDACGGNFFVTLKDSDVVVREVAKIIGYAINRTFYPEIEFQDMARLL